MYVFISKMLVGTDHSIRVRGRWKTNSYSTNWREVVFSTESSDDRLKLGKLSSFGVGSPTGEMSAYKKMKISGNLVTENGPTVVGTYTGATTSGLDGEGALADGAHLVAHHSYRLEVVGLAGLQRDLLAVERR